MLARTIVGISRAPVLCTHSDDIAAHGDACAAGTYVMQGLDEHTRTMYRILKKIASTRDDPDPVSHDVAVPTLEQPFAKISILPSVANSPSIPCGKVDEDFPSTFKQAKNWVVKQVSKKRRRGGERERA